MNQRRVLFVDDEPHVLRAIANRLRRHRHRWEMVFTTSGAEALVELSRARFDVIVSDLRMPGMDGAELLERARAAHPCVVRIVLSGHADQRTVIGVLPFAHRYLIKPCDAEELASTIERTCEIQAMLGKPILREVVGRLDRIPSVPRLYAELIARVAEPGVGPSELSRIIECDPAMAAKVIQLASSSCFGPARPVVSIRQAVRELGVELLSTRALTQLAFVPLPPTPDCEREFSLERVQTHSLTSARLAARMVSNPALADAAFTAGLLHDVGRIVIAMNLRPQHARVLAMLRDGASREEAERVTLGVTHAEVGAYLLGVWGLPHAIVEAVACHHGSERGSGDCALLDAVRAAEAFAEAMEAGDGLSETVERARPGLERTGLGGRIDELRDAFTRELAALREPSAAGAPARAA